MPWLQQCYQLNVWWWFEAFYVQHSLAALTSKCEMCDNYVTLCQLWQGMDPTHGAQLQKVCNRHLWQCCSVLADGLIGCCPIPFHHATVLLQ